MKVLASSPFARAAAAVTLTAAQASASPDSAADPLQALAFLAGHCYTGSVRDNGVDEHCFTWILDGRALRDVHVVRNPGRPDYAGETTYYYDSVAQRVEYLYLESEGGVMRGSVEAADGALVFPAATFLANGQSMTIRARWTLQADGYEAWSEAQHQGAWATMFKVRMTKSS